jgi:hypothetical protein
METQTERTGPVPKRRQLAAGLDEHGIGYVHLPKLGTPRRVPDPFGHS